MSSPSPVSSQLLTGVAAIAAPVGSRVRRCTTVSSCRAQAISRARTVASTLGRLVLRIWFRRRSCVIRFNTSSTCHRARYSASTAAVDHVAASSVVITRIQPATARVGTVSVRPAFWALRRWVELGGDEPDAIPTPLPAAPAVPVACGATRLPEPAQHRERLAPLRFQGERGGVETQEDVRVLAHGERHTAAIPIASVRHNPVPSLPLGAPQMFAPATVGALDLPQPARCEVVGQRQPPVIPCPARLAEAAGIDKQDTPLWVDAQCVGRCGRGDQRAQEPEQPRVPRTEALAPRGFGDIRDPHQHRPGAQPARGQGPQDVRQEAPQQVVRRGEPSHPLERFEGPGLRGEGRWQARHHFGRPRIPHEGRLCMGDGVGMMGEDQHRHLLKMVSCSNETILQESLCWSELSLFRCLSSRLWVRSCAVGDAHRCFGCIKDWVEKQVRRHLRRARHRKGLGWKRWRRRWLYDTLRLFHNYRVRRPQPKALPVPEVP